MENGVKVAGRPEDQRTGSGETAAEVRKVYLFPSRLFASSEPCAVTTILGSCVAVCLWDPGLRAGGVNHYLLPHWVGANQSSPRFGNLAIERLLEEMTALGARRGDLQAKIFGGARILETVPDETTHLGARNVAVAHEILARECVPIVAEDVGGQGGRKLIFNTQDGSAWVRRF